MSKKRKKKKNNNQSFIILFGFVLLGFLAYVLDSDGFGDNIFQVGKGFAYIIILVIFGIILVELSRER